MVNFLEYLGQGTLGSHTTSQPAFGHFSSPKNIPVHSSYLFTLIAFNMLYKLVFLFYKDPLKVLHSHIKAPKGHLKGPLAHESDMPLVDSSCCHGKV